MKNQIVTGLIISAGLSKRMGRLKPLIKYKGTPFLIHVAQKMKAVCQKIIIVTGYQSMHIKNEINAWLIENDPEIIRMTNWCHNPHFETGMLSSLQKGLMQAGKSDWILYHFADQPAIPRDFYSDLVQHINDDFDWIQPMFKGQHGHPILISKRLVSQILTLNSTHSLRDIAKDEKLKSHIYECNFPEILDDYDTPQQLKNL